MANHPKFLKIRYHTWWIIFFSVQAALIILMGCTFGANTWVYSDNKGILHNYDWDDDSNNVYNGKKFEGDLFVCKEGCDKDYGKLAQEWCGFYDDQKDNLDAFNIDDEILDPYLSVCAMYFSLYIGMSIYTALETISMICICVWALAMLCYCRKVNCLWLTYCCTGCMWVFHYIALIAYMSITRSNFDGDCDSLPTKGDRPKLCAGSGPALSLFILVIIPFISIFYCVVACRLQKTYGHGGLDKDGLKGDTVHKVVELPAVDLSQPGYGPQYYGQAPGIIPGQYSTPYAPGPFIYPQPPPVYSQPPPGYSQPPPVYSQPQPVYSQPPPVNPSQPAPKY